MAFCNKQCLCGADCTRQDNHDGLCDCHDLTCSTHRSEKVIEQKQQEKIKLLEQMIVNHELIEIVLREKIENLEKSVTLLSSSVELYQQMLEKRSHNGL